ncbi:hypothetical protein [Chitinophaga fulva]|nr:hypothetical protein [Chitinophaga fulva]
MLQFLGAHHLVDTAHSVWRLYDDTVSLGKYYRQREGTFIACMLDPVTEEFPIHLLIEANLFDDVLKVERYFHWNSPCCWERNDGFTKWGDYYFLKICGTGSGYCSTNLFCFQDVVPQDSLRHVVAGYWSAMGNTGTDNIWNIESNMQINGDTLWMHYKLEEFDQEDTVYLQPKDTATFTVMYLKDKKGWRAVDSTMLEKYSFY